MYQRFSKKTHGLAASLLLFLFISCRPEDTLFVANDPVPSFNKIVVVIGENEKASTVFDSINDAPYINSLAHSGAAFVASFGIQHPSQPNYLCLFSGSNQGINDNNIPAEHFTTPNLARELLNSEKTFSCYSEDLPYIGCDDSSSGLYARKHNPVSNWTGSGHNQVPSFLNRPFSDMPSDFSLLPDVSFIIPNLCNDGHDVCSPDSNRTKQFDHWLETNLNAYKNWCLQNNSLLIVTYDEDDWSGNNRIATVFYGAHVRQGVYTDTINHYTLLRTIEDALRLPRHAGAAENEKPIDFCWDLDN